MAGILPIRRKAHESIFCTLHAKKTKQRGPAH